MERVTERPKYRIIAAGILGIVTLLGTLLAVPATSSAAGTLADVPAPAPAEPPAETAPGAPAGPDAEHADGERLIVSFHPGTDDADRLDAAAEAGVEVVEVGDVLPIAVVDASDPAEATTALLTDPAVAHVEPDVTIEIEHRSNDTELLAGRGAWGLAGPRETASLGVAEFGADAVAAWERGHIGSPDVHVAVLDTGIDLTHPDLVANLWRNPGEIPGNGIDDDGNGYVDDIHGWDFHDGDADVSHNGISDSESHGTRVAGVIGAVGGNGIGVAGVAWQVGIVPVRTLSGSTGKASAGVLAIDYVIDLKRRYGVNLVAINASWSTPAFTYALQDAVRRAGQAGIVVVSAAGNRGGNNDASPLYPASLSCASYGYPWDCVVSVAAHGPDGVLVGDSVNRGWSTNTGATSVDLAAPGVALATTHPGGTYAQMNGTSAATPMVAGAVALCAAAAPSIPAQKRTELLNRTVVPLAGASGRIATGGRLDVAGYLAACTASAAGASGYGAVERLRASSGSTAEVTGWASGFASQAATVEVQVNGTAAATIPTAAVATNVATGSSTSRPPFTAEVPLAAGNNEVCVGFPGAPRLLGCASVRGAAGGEISGRLTSSGPRDRAWVLEGWAIDPATASATAVWATVNGKRVAADEGVGPAEQFTADYPGWNPGAAFSLAIDHLRLPRQAAGQVCVHAARADGRGEVVLGCTLVRHPGTLNPVGSLEVASTHGRGLVVSGWAFDPDRAEPVTVEVSVNGTRRHAKVTSLRRSDVTRTYPGFTQPSGYRIVLPELLTSGRHRVCVVAVNEGPGANSQLGCRTVTARGGNPIGSFDGARRTTDGIRVNGWALDHDHQGAVSVHLYVNGRFTRAIDASAERRDVARAHPAYGPQRGFDLTLSLPRGSQRVCAYAINVRAGTANTLLGCRTVR